MPTFSFSLQTNRSATAIHLFKDLTTIGRSENNDIVIPDPLLDEEHAFIQFDGESFTLIVHDKKNIFSVNGRGRKSSKLKHNDKIELGATTCCFRMLAEDIPQESKPMSSMESVQRLYDFSKKLMKTHLLQELLETLMDEVLEITQAERGFLILMEGNDPSVAIGRNIAKENLFNPIELFSDSIVRKTVETQKPLILSDAMHNPEFNQTESIVNLQLSSVMCVPLMTRGKMLGVLYVGNSKMSSLFDSSSLETLVVFASQASLILQNAILVNELQSNNEKLQEQLKDIQSQEIIGTSERIQLVLTRIKKVASTDVSVLIQGETGTGKELVAKEIHRLSNRSKGPFITINCGAIPENLLESELFGHVKGAFTGAVSEKAGKFEAAHGGTIFLDEIGELALALQVKLLRVLQERVVTRIGENTGRKIDIRILAATNRVLETEAKEGRFREDLYYRLNVISIQLPPLRDRGSDVVLIARFFLKKLTAEYNSSIKGFSPDAMLAIQRAKWPGNIRELENKIRKAVILSDGALVSKEDLDLKEENCKLILSLQEAKEQFQSQYIHEVLQLNQGNRTQTAKDLGVDPRTIFRQLEKENTQEDNEKSDW